ncbi:hypothetical protein [uncultured Sphingomonas sp.]|uniref:hypothetical protein n=1 Tax=uncultured Sphingomonas sp. TaxID=158754 RepID=UPI0025F8EDF4|nr:hypothetical protein [uncultured Sphingomonas sp.]
MAAKLKVFRTPIGFHDAYVAGPSQKAALAAWGSDHDLFARHEAELVTDPALTEQPLAEPGAVIRRLRGSEAEQIAALGDGKVPPKAKPNRAPAPKPRPRPKRTALDQAEQRLSAARDRQREEQQALAAREAVLAAERRAMEARQRAETRDLEAKVDSEQASYDAALRRWHG